MMYMLTPQPKKQKHKKKESGLKVFLSITIIFCLMFFAWFQEKSTAEPSVEDNHISDFSQLWKWGDALLQEGSNSGEWTFRWDVQLTSINIEQLSIRFFTDAKGNAMPKFIRKNGQVIDGAGVLKGSHIQLSVINDKNNTNMAQDAIILLQIEQGSIDGYDQIKRYLAEIHNIVMEQDAKAKFSMKVFGVSNNKDSLKTIKQLSVGQVLDQYNDDGTTSHTLYTNMIQDSIWLNGDKMANLQLSQHSNNLNDEQTLTLGVPLISGEFGESVPKK